MPARQPADNNEYIPAPGGTADLQTGELVMVHLDGATERYWQLASVRAGSAATGYTVRVEDSGNLVDVPTQHVRGLSASEADDVTTAYRNHSWIKTDDSGLHKICRRCQVHLDRLGRDVWFSLPGQGSQQATDQDPVPPCAGWPEPAAPTLPFIPRRARKDTAGNRHG